MTMREKLARALWKQWHFSEGLDDDLGETVWQQDKVDFLPMVDATLCALLEPTEGMVEAAIPRGRKGTAIDRHRRVIAVAAWQAMIQHILDESDGQAPQA